MSVNTETPDPNEHDEIDEEAISDEEKARMFDMLAAMAARTAGKVSTKENVEKPKETSREVEDSQEWAHGQYERLTDSWSRLGITVPTEEELTARLEAAATVINDMVSDKPVLSGKMAILLVPPSDQVGWPVSDDLRRRQGLEPGSNGVDLHVNNHIKKKRVLRRNETSTADHVHGITPPAPSAEWRVFVTDVTDEGTYLGSPNDILERTDKHSNGERKTTHPYIIGGYDTRGMGAAEYAALSLQEARPVLRPDGHRSETTRPIDTAGYTLLMKDYVPGPGRTVGYAGFHSTVHDKYIFKPGGQHFAFDTMNPDYKRGHYHYRPTVEIHEPDPLALASGSTEPLALPAGPPVPLPKRKPGGSDPIPMPPASS